VRVLQAGRSFDLESLVDFDEVVTCLPVIQEVLQGFKDENAYRIARQSMSALPTLEAPLGLAVFEEAANLYRLARRAGLTIRSSVDCLIAACAIRHDAELLHRDRDFSALAKVSPLRERSI
jgi:predicted nucleic acid-binding protein